MSTLLPDLEHLKDEEEISLRTYNALIREGINSSQKLLTYITNNPNNIPKGIGSYNWQSLLNLFTPFVEKRPDRKIDETPQLHQALFVMCKPEFYLEELLMDYRRIKRVLHCCYGILNTKSKAHIKDRFNDNTIDLHFFYRQILPGITTIPNELLDNVRAQQAFSMLGLLKSAVISDNSEEQMRLLEWRCFMIEMGTLTYSDEILFELMEGTYDLVGASIAELLNTHDIGLKVDMHELCFNTDLSYAHYRSELITAKFYPSKRSADALDQYFKNVIKRLPDYYLQLSTSQLNSNLIPNFKFSGKSEFLKDCILFQINARIESS